MLETVLSSTSDAGELVEHLLSKSIAGNYIISGKVECWKQLSLTIHFKSIQACSSNNVITCKTSKHSLTFCVHVEHYLFSDNGISQVVQSWLHGFRLLWLITRWLSRCVLVRCAHCRHRRTASVQTSSQNTPTLWSGERRRWFNIKMPFFYYNHKEDDSEIVLSSYWKFIYMGNGLYIEVGSRLLFQ